MTAIVGQKEKDTLTRRVSFSELPPEVHVTSDEDDELQGLFTPKCGHVDGVKALCHGETCYFHLGGYQGLNGEAVAPALAEVLEAQRVLGSRVSKCEAERAELLDRLRDLEIEHGLARPAVQKRERKVSFSMDTVSHERSADKQP